MGRSVKVEISGREFPSKKAAVDYFMDQREAVKGSGPIREGHLFEDLRELYICNGSQSKSLGLAISAISGSD